MFSPKDAETFFLGDLDVYLDSETQPAFYTRAEKPITPTAEYVEFLDGIPQNLVRKDIIRFGLSIGLIILEWTADIIELTRGGLKVITDPNYKYVYYGEDYVEPITHRFRMVGELRNTKAIEFVILKGKTTDMGEIPTGGTDYNEIPATIEALRDSTVSDVQKNLAYFRFEK
jgi:hypothetical protein